MATDPSEPPFTSPFDDTEVPLPLGKRPKPTTKEQKDRVRAALFDDTPLPPECLGRFIVLGSLGRGGMGIVLEAYDPSLDRKVALKVLHPEVAQRHAQRLVREAKGLAKLSHPNVVQVYEVVRRRGVRSSPWSWPPATRSRPGHSKSPGRAGGAASRCTSRRDEGWPRLMRRGWSTATSSRRIASDSPDVTSALQKTA